MPADPAPARRALALLHRVAETAADDVRRVDAGTVLHTPSLPSGWSVNCLRVERAQPPLTLHDAAALADVGTSFRHVRIHDPDAARPLAAEAEGWRRSAELVMLLTPTEAPPAPRVAARDGTLDDLMALQADWLVEEGHTRDGSVLGELLEMTRREHAALPERRLFIDDGDRAVAMCTVRWDGDVVQLEDVYVRPEARRRHLGRAIVSAGIHAALARDPGVVCIVADADDWPRELYARLGFRDAARMTVLHRGA